MLNGSIRSYVYLLITSQVDAHTNIYYGNSKEDAIAAYLENFDIVIDKDVRIGESVRRLERVLDKASSRVNFTVWPELNIIPSKNFRQNKSLQWQVTN